MSETVLNPVVAKSLDQYACDEQATAYASSLVGIQRRLLAWLTSGLTPDKDNAYGEREDALRDALEWAFRAGWEAARDAQRMA